MELEHGIQHVNMTIPHEHVKIVDQLDTDHDGKISYAEFARLLHSQEAQSGRHLRPLAHRRNAVEDPILSFPDPNHVGNAHPTSTATPRCAEPTATSTREGGRCVRS